MVKACVFCKLVLSCAFGLGGSAKTFVEVCDLFVKEMDVGFFVDNFGYGVCYFLIFFVRPLGLYSEFLLGLFKVELKLFDGSVEGVDFGEEGVASSEEGSEG